MAREDDYDESKAQWVWAERAARARVAELEAALRSVMVGGNHVALLIGSDHPSHTATHDDARKHYAMQEQYEAWCCWRTIMHARDVLEQKWKEAQMRGVKVDK